MKSKPLKGCIGYIDRIKKDSLLIGLLGFAIFLVIYFSGIALTKTNQNYGTILAVLIALPTAQMFTRYIGYRRYSSVPIELVNALEVYNNSSILYEMLLVRGKVTYYIDAIVVTNKQIVLLSLTGKALKQDEGKARQELQTLMNHKGIKVNTVLFETVDDLNRYMVDNDFEAESPDNQQQEAVVKAFLGSGM